MKFFNSHLSAAQIADAIDGKLPVDRQDKLKTHLADCAHCRREYSIFAKAIGLMQSDNSINAPAEAINFARNIFRTRKAFAPVRKSVVQKIAARLKLDVSPLAPAFGERSASSASERQMFFEAGDYDVDLRVKTTENGFAISGQILGELAAKNSIHLIKEDFEKSETISELGEFSFTEISAGTYNLQILVGDKEIDISDLVIS